MVDIYLENPTGTFNPWTGEAIGGVKHDPSIGQEWPDEALADLGLYKPVTTPIPSDKIVKSSSVQRVDGVVRFVYELESVPLADLNRIQFEFMVEKLGLGEAISAAIEAMPENDELEQNAKILARVLFRSGQKFERSHPLFTTLAPAVGFTTEQIDAAWIVALTI